MKIDYNSLLSEMIDTFGESKTMVLATAFGEKVTARSMSCVFDGINILFQTDSGFQKVEQIMNNTNVALCYQNIQIEGAAKLCGHPAEKQNEIFIEKFKKSFKSSFELYSDMKNEIVIEVNPTLITIWKYENGKPLRDYLDVCGKLAYREYYLIE
ncbi:MAG: pyridoxamine 5'-phosphate oxidase family protein [Bacteroidota bacterium]|nr:pyridoxamine 5'-phosphate oxidase family protein [Bacteroidota bacterium]